MGKTSRIPTRQLLYWLKYTCAKTSQWNKNINNKGNLNMSVVNLDNTFVIRTVDIDFKRALNRFLQNHRNQNKVKTA